jgi:hypothetical protein
LAIAQDHDYFETVREDPAALADGGLASGEKLAKWEMVSYVAYHVTVELAGRENDEDYPGRSMVFAADEPAALWFVGTTQQPGPCRPCVSQRVRARFLKFWEFLVQSLQHMYRVTASAVE